jgi:ribonucleoside-diphosphate reductase alpha chain
LIQVTKRDGSKEPLNIEKLHRVTSWACEDLTGVSPSELEMKAQLQFYNGIKTSDVQETLIKAAGDLISEETPNYQYVAGRLINYHLRKEVYGGFEPRSLKDHINWVLNEHPGFYDPEILNWYSDAELDLLNSKIKHDRDFDLTYAAMGQFRGKYLVRNRVTNKYLETPQMVYMLIAMTLFNSYKNDRIKWVLDYYDGISEHIISLPTPIMAGVRTKERQFSSCVLIETGDSLNSIIATTGAIVKYVSKRAGIGVGAGSIRALNSAVRDGDTTHTGPVNFYRLFQSATQSCNQGGIRKGSSTLSFMWWHKDIEDLVVLKNNKGTEDNRVRHMDYCVQLNRLFYERALNDQEVTLFSPKDVPDLYEAFFVDQDRFEELYVKYEQDTSLKVNKISALELFQTILQERYDTGRVYLQNIDHCNTHGSFIAYQAAIRMTNLCVEVTLPTQPLQDLYDDDGEIALCILSAVNQGLIKTPADYKRACTLAVRGLDALIDHQSYLLPAAARSALRRRPLGVGIINLAYWLAKNDTTYQDPDLAMIDEFAEAFSYYLIRASVDLAKEFGPCQDWMDTKYSLGLFPHDTRKIEVDELTPHKLRLDWTALKADMLEYGIRNSTLMAGMPAETSAQIANATNGFEPPPAAITSKGSKDSFARQVVPESRRLKNKYDYRWTHRRPTGYLSIIAIWSKWMDQAISANINYNPIFYPSPNPDEPPAPSMDDLIDDTIFAYRYGIKNLYYVNVEDGAGEMEDPDDCEGCKI